MADYHVRLSHGWESTKEKKRERFKASQFYCERINRQMGSKKTSRHSKRV